jgi:serine/threonine protein kinase
MEIPKTIGPFELRQRIGQGTYGDVYEAFDPEREIRVALKLFGKAPRGEVAFARLRRDAEAAGALGHPNIAAVIGVGELEGYPWVASELITGVSLAQVIRSRMVWPIERVLDVWRQLCEGLAHAHREGLLHLDLKPSDVRVNAGGEVKVVDFGGWHVKTLERRRRGPASEESLHYRAPEVVAGQRPDQRADIFAVGAIIYELVTRRKAFPGEHTTDVVRSLSRCEPDLASLPSSPFSPGLERMLAVSLDRDPEARPSSFEDVHADLVELVRETAPRLREPAGAGEPPEPEREAVLAALTRARAEDRLEDALGACRELLALDPDDEFARRSLSEVESVILSREADELVGRALAHAADGEIEVATRLAEKVERLAPWNPRYLELQVYLDEERARRNASRLVATARAHQAAGRTTAARAAAEEALAAMPGLGSAEELLGDLGAAEAPPVSAPPEEPPEPRSTPGSPEPSSPPEPMQPPRPASPPSPRPETTPEDRARQEAARLTAEALDLFTGNDHARARKVLDRALALDPSNRRARDLRTILRALG